MNAEPTISVEQLAKKIGQSNVEVIDVRTPAEFQEFHLACARNVPLDSLDPGAVMNTRRESQQPLYLICKGGSRGANACHKFSVAGYSNVANVDGGMEACLAAGLPVIRGKRTVSLERQVRIAAGLLVLIGAVFGYFWNPIFISLSAFVGAGLMFAGITDTCGMAMLLSRMPWNQVSLPDSKVGTDSRSRN